jgi:hypothetical protein
MASIFEPPASFRDLRIVLVRELPGFHNPFRCDRPALFTDPVQTARVAARRRTPLAWLRPPAELPFEQEAAIMTRVRETLSFAEVAGCRYHQVDWGVVASVACDLVETHAQHLNEDHVSRAGSPLDDRERESLWSLFTEPIRWYPGTNGQHRACGLWFSGACKFRSHHAG